jgi:hypothetical protein
MASYRSCPRQTQTLSAVASPVISRSDVPPALGACPAVASVSPRWCGDLDNRARTAVQRSAYTQPKCVIQSNSPADTNPLLLAGFRPFNVSSDILRAKATRAFHHACAKTWCRPRTRMGCCPVQSGSSTGDHEEGSSQDDRESLLQQTTRTAIGLVPEDTPRPTQSFRVAGGKETERTNPVAR